MPLCVDGQIALNGALITLAKMTAMTSPPDKMNHEDVLRIKLEVLKREHRDLDAAIEALGAAATADQLTLKRLKKQKLFLKDRIARIEDELTPDIIA